MDAFEEMGCRASDHALEYVMYVTRNRRKSGKDTLQNANRVKC